MRKKTIYQFHGCKWHGCLCQKIGTENDIIRYEKTKNQEDEFGNLDYKVVSVWECEKPELSNKFFEKKFVPYPYFIVFDFEAILKKVNEIRTKELLISSEHVPISCAINDNFTNEAVFIVDENPKKLIEKFMEVLKNKRKTILLKIEELFPKTDDFGMLPSKVQNDWNQWVNQVPVFGFNSSSYDINLIKEYFVSILSENSDIFVAKKEQNYFFLTNEEFKFLDIRNYLSPDFSYEKWCESHNCELKKLFFPYEWLDNPKKLEQKGPVKIGDFYSSLKGNISNED